MSKDIDDKATGLPLSRSKGMEAVNAWGQPGSSSGDGPAGPGFHIRIEVETTSWGRRERIAVLSVAPEDREEQYHRAWKIEVQQNRGALAVPPGLKDKDVNKIYPPVIWLDEECNAVPLRHAAAFNALWAAARRLAEAMADDDDWSPATPRTIFLDASERA